MKVKKLDKQIIIDKSDKLKSVINQLKKEYIGLDSIIDEIHNLIEPWYIFPSSQIRPTVINLWGLTSTGKTSLIMRLFNLLDLSSVLKFDTGEWVDKTDFELTHKKIG